MAISFQNALGTYEAALQVRTKRAEMLSSNLANADTPNFKAKDLDFQQALRAQMASQDAGTQGVSHMKHMKMDGSIGMNSAMQYRTPTQPSIDGNTVDEHIEHAEFMSNSLEFQATFTMLNSRFKGLVRAIKGE